FFFQAEDGIRDLYVTGVQTCALPISLAAAVAAGLLDHFAGAVADRAGPLDHEEALLRADLAMAAALLALVHGGAGLGAGAIAGRSEERRVGKEWRSGWAADQETEKVE